MMTMLKHSTHSTPTQRLFHHPMHFGKQSLDFYTLGSDGGFSSPDDDFIAPVPSMPCDQYVTK
ncbi:hypothetical protein SCTVLC_0422 [Serratia symbiotica SCt-VLC]|uniref:Uncharacterized protein n=1 Tax=Serratia symbiotica SCt-VLC TaxID=1347341 RepID=A0A068RC66_9GAMM|nr:hypothetical protein SCTVLC_0422 [Serratia symbiotica SCt-VLC]